jgi:pyruvate/2-oxoglutarate dehydrogenase complex dihydrolipoamide acyltransferase (E2) component
MTVQILLPKLGFSMEEGTLVEWLVPDGAEVVEGTAVYTLEGDKAVQEIEAPASGRLRVIAPSDATYPVGALLGEID